MPRRLVALCLLALLSTTPRAALADDASRWDGDARSAVRLIGASRPAGSSGPIQAGLEIRLGGGWHTYWRHPGDAGVPPHFDFSGSRNLGKVVVGWPAPRRISEGRSVSIGYDATVIFPLRIEPDGNGPVSLRVKTDYAICQKLCVPAEGRAELSVPASGRSQDRQLAAAVARLPKRRPLGDAAALAIRSVTVERGAERPHVVVEVAAPDGVAVDLFAEGPTPKWALPVPTLLVPGPGGVRRFGFGLDGAPAGQKFDRVQVTLTAVTATGAIEVTTRLD